MLLLSLTALGVSIIALFFSLTSRPSPLTPSLHTIQLRPHDLECLSSGLPISVGDIEVEINAQAASELSEALQLLRMDRLTATNRTRIL